MAASQRCDLWGAVGNPKIEEMKAIMLKLAALVCLFTLAACGQSEPEAPAAPMPSDPSAQVRVSLQTTPLSPDWVVAARQRDCPEVGEVAKERCPYGEVLYNQRTITRSVDGSVANLWAQVNHAAPQLYMAEDESTVTRIRYTQSRLHYRFRCADETFAIIERQIMGENETVVQRDSPREIYRAPQRWSAVALLMPIACRGGELQP
jgi:predicted small lipoprotein YifL